jgi:hypothetical protein
MYFTMTFFQGDYARGQRTKTVALVRLGTFGTVDRG